MPENRYFIDQPLKQGESLQIPKEELKHLRVMRKQPGDSIELVNGRNQLAQATLTDLETATLTAVHQTAPSREIILALGLLRPKNLDWVIEKGTELGATSFWLFPAQKSEKKGLSENQQSRLRHLTISALKQCGRLDLPSIILKPTLSDWDPLPIPLFYGDLEATTPFAPKGSVIIAIGPESGFTSHELQTLLSLGGTSIRLSSNTLRAETAAICALSKTS